MNDDYPRWCMFGSVKAKNRSASLLAEFKTWVCKYCDAVNNVGNSYCLNCKSPRKQ